MHSGCGVVETSERTVEPTEQETNRQDNQGEEQTSKGLVATHPREKTRDTGSLGNARTADLKATTGMTQHTQAYMSVPTHVSTPAHQGTRGLLAPVGLGTSVNQGTLGLAAPVGLGTPVDSGTPGLREQAAVPWMGSGSGKGVVPGDDDDVVGDDDDEGNHDTSVSKNHMSTGKHARDTVGRKSCLLSKVNRQERHGTQKTRKVTFHDTPVVLDASRQTRGSHTVCDSDHVGCGHGLVDSSPPSGGTWRIGAGKVDKDPDDDPFDRDRRTHFSGEEKTNHDTFETGGNRDQQDESPKGHVTELCQEPVGIGDQRERDHSPIEDQDDDGRPEADARAQSGFRRIRTTWGADVRPGVDRIPRLLSVGDDDIPRGIDMCSSGTLGNMVGHRRGSRTISEGTCGDEDQEAGEGLQQEGGRQGGLHECSGHGKYSSSDHDERVGRDSEEPFSAGRGFERWQGESPQDWRGRSHFERVGSNDAMSSSWPEVSEEICEDPLAKRSSLDCSHARHLESGRKVASRCLVTKRGYHALGNGRKRTMLGGCPWCNGCSEGTHRNFV